MKNPIKLILPAALLIAATSFGQTATPVVTQRQVTQQQRIHQGKKSGELTKPEARRLQMREAKIQHDKRVAKADGKVTPAEKAKLTREQNRTSRAIHRQKHDAQKK